MKKDIKHWTKIFVTKMRYHLFIGIVHSRHLDKTSKKCFLHFVQKNLAKPEIHFRKYLNIKFRESFTYHVRSSCRIILFSNFIVVNYVTMRIKVVR
jgi:hypothetical protein